MYGGGGIFLSLSYGAAALTLATTAAALPVGAGAAFSQMERAVLGASALALLCDFAPAALRDTATAAAAKEMCIDELLDASPSAILVDNFVKPLEPMTPQMEAAKARATQRLERVNAWATRVRARIIADAIGTLVMLRYNACLGAALTIAAHAAMWAGGVALVRVDAQGDPRPISPPLARLIGAVTAVLAASATVGAFGRGAFLRAAGGWGYAGAMVSIQGARLMADRVRQRTHVGL